MIFAGYSPRLIPQSSVKPIEEVFQTTERNIRKHLRQCNVQELVTNFNMIVNKKNFPILKIVSRKSYTGVKQLVIFLLVFLHFQIGKIEKYSKLLWRSQVAQRQLLS